MEEDNAAAPQTSVVLLPGEDAERGAHYDRASQILAVAASVESHMASLAAAAAGAKSAAFYAANDATMLRVGKLAGRVDTLKREEALLKAKIKAISTDIASLIDKAQVQNKKGADAAQKKTALARTAATTEAFAAGMKELASLGANDIALLEVHGIDTSVPVLVEMGTPSSGRMLRIEAGLRKRRLSLPRAGGFSATEFGPFRLVVDAYMAFGLLSRVEATIQCDDPNTVATAKFAMGQQFMHPHAGRLTSAPAPGYGKRAEAIVCLGTSKVRIEGAVRAGDILAALRLVGSALAEYNNNSPHLALSHWEHTAECSPSVNRVPLQMITQVLCPQCGSAESKRVHDPSCGHCASCCASMHKWSAELALARSGVGYSGCYVAP
jgi:hypothetical protein